jgi:pre-mRNA-processing factor 40
MFPQYEQQTKSLKLEKEALKSKARKSRANFLVMLAENTVIDAHTRWREASTLLQEDARFKNVEDARDREDLFNDFVSELEKKEKEDRLKHRGEALKFLNTSLTARHSSGALSRKSTWTEEREGLLKMQEVRFLDDAEVKRCFQDFIGKLDFAFKETERVKKLELQRKIDIASADLRELFEKLAYEGVISSNSRWSECSSRPCIADSTAFKEFENLIKNEKHDKHERSENSNNASVMGSARDIFDKVLVVVREASRADKRLILDVLRDWEFEMMHTCTLQEFKDAVYSAAGVKTATHSQNISTHKSAIVCDIASLTEDGEEIEEDEELEDTSRVAFGKQLRGMLVKRPFALENVFADLLEEEKRRHAKSEIRFLTLLDEYFFEHPNDTWDECKREIHRHPAYTDMWRADRERAYTLFMNNKLQAKAKRKEKEKEERVQDKEREKDKDKDEESEKSKDTRDKKSKEIRISEEDKESHSTTSTSANGKGSADTHTKPSTLTAHVSGEDKVEAGVEEKIQAITSDGGCDITGNNTNDSGDIEKGKEREREETSSDNESKKRKLDHAVDI